MKTTLKWAVAATATAVLMACGGSGSEPPAIVTANAVVPASPAVAAAVANETFQYPSGVPALGTTGATSIKIEGTAAALTATVTGDGMTASSDLGFGSCILSIKVSSFPATHPMGVGKTLTINPCTFYVPTSGTTADGQPRSIGVTLDLGGTLSLPVPLPVVVNPNGQITLNGSTLSVTVPVAPVTGS